MLESIKVIAYKILKRIIVANVSYFKILVLTELREHRTDIELHTIEDPDELNGEWDFGDLYTVWYSRLKKQDISMCCAVLDNRVVGRLWWIRNLVPPDLNHDGTPATELPLELPRDTIFVFDVCVHPDYRGKRLFAAMMTRVKEHLRNQEEIMKILITVEYSNRPSVRAARWMGFKEVGQSRLFAFRDWSLTYYPDNELSPIKIGRYTGDPNF